MGKVFQFLGMVIGIAGGAALAGIFLIVFVNGSWPDFLLPIRERFRDLSEFAGNWNFPILVAVFVGPGGIIYWIGSSLREREWRRDLTKKSQGSAPPP